MRMLHVIVSAVVGGAIGFAASHTVSQRDDPAPMVAAAVDKAVKKAVDARLATLGVETAADLDGKISGGVAQFLADSPEAVVAALEKYQANEQAKEAQKRKDSVRNLRSVLTEQPAGPSAWRRRRPPLTSPLSSSLITAVAIANVLWMASWHWLTKIRRFVSC